MARSQAWVGADTAAVVVPAVIILLLAIALTALALRLKNPRRFAPTDSSKPMGLLIAQIDGVEEVLNKGSNTSRERVAWAIQKVTRVVQRLAKRHGVFIYNIDSDSATYFMAARTASVLLDLAEALHVDLMRENWGDAALALEQLYRKAESVTNPECSPPAQPQTAWKGPRMRIAAHFGFGSVEGRPTHAETTSGLSFGGDAAAAVAELLGLARGGETLVSQSLREALEGADRQEQCVPESADVPTLRIFLPGFGPTVVHRFTPPSLMGRNFPRRVLSPLEDTGHPLHSSFQELFSRRSVLSSERSDTAHVECNISMISFDSSAGEHSGRSGSPRNPSE